MVRSTQLLHPQREPAPLRNAATVLLLRDSPEGLQVLMTRRNPNASFAPGAFVFPGGMVDADDTAPEVLALVHRRPSQTDAGLAAAITAIRESFEELGVLLARTASGDWVPPADVSALDRHAPLWPQVASKGWQLATDEVFVYCHWTTDRDLSKRFDVPFLIAPMPPGQTPVADEAEQFEPVWVSPADALARHAQGQFFIIYPTVKTLAHLQRYTTVAAALAACASETPLWTTCPRSGLLAGKEVRHMEHEPEFGELALVCPDGQMLHHLDWQSDHPVALLKHVQRLTCPNPGMMTGPGTNSYVVGDAATGFIVIDPGPNEPEHLERLLRATGGRIQAIVCTHSHPDHSPGAQPLQAMCVATGGMPPPIYGLPSAPTARAHSTFTPDLALEDSQTLVLQGGGLTHTLQAIHTPGHAANHVCLWLQEDGLLFSGDHILNGSTTVIDPPDGHMADYIDSLDKLAARVATVDEAFILPAHGHVLGNATGAIAQLKAHRLAREAKVAAAMQALPQGTADDWVAHAYADVPERLWPVAKRSLLAHVDRIQSLGGFNV